ncbi:MAG: holo-ACP synthase [Actinomycetota bacterium]
MKIYAVGTDIIEVHRIAEAVNKYPLFVSRVYTRREIAYCENKGSVRHHSFAARFAAKEAVAKSLGTGFGKNLSLTDIEILSDKAKPEVYFSGRGAELVKGLGISRVEASISSTGSYAVAFAVSIIE